MRRCWLGLMMILLFGALVGSRAMVYAQDEGGGGGGEVAAPVEDTGGGGGEAPAPAAGGGGGATAEPVKTSVFRMVWENSGPAGFSIIILSVVALYMAIRFFYYYRAIEMIPPMLVAQVDDDLNNGRLREAVMKCNLSPSAFARVMKEAFVKMDAGYEGMVEGMEEAGGVEATRCQQQVSWLSVIGAIAPMLGLLGTVSGMMGAFGVIAQSETTPPPRELAKYIQLALVTTVEGLVVAIPVLLAYSFFRGKINELMLQLGGTTLGMVERFKGVEITPAMVAEVRDAAGMRAETAIPTAGPEAGPPPMEGGDAEAAPPPPPPE